MKPMEVPVNLTVGPTASSARENGQGTGERSPVPTNPVFLGGEKGVEWVVASLVIAALIILILFRLAGFQAALAVRVGG